MVPQFNRTGRCSDYYIRHATFPRDTEIPRGEFHDALSLRGPEC